MLGQFRRLAPVFAMVALACLVTARAEGPGAPVLLVDLDTVIHPLTGEIVRDSLAEAARAGDRAVVLRINTPGGLLTTTNEIVQAILASPIPVITFVSPSGGHAASAGFIILVSADVAAMAPGTNTGAAHPVLALGGELEGAMKAKVENDTAASLRAVTDKRGRNSKLATEAVLESASFTEQDALEAELIEVIASDLDHLLRQVHGRTITRFDGREQVLDLEGATVRTYVPNLRQRVLLPLVDPRLALLVLVLGAAGIYVEFTNPGLIFPGVAGGILLIVGLMALSLLPINVAGAALIILAMGLFITEAFTPVNGILAIGGVIAMVLGIVILIDSDVPELQIGWLSATAITLPFAVISVFLLQLAVRSFRIKAATGTEAMVGELAQVRRTLEPEGTVFLQGELWNARASVAVDRGQAVRVTAVDGMWLQVEPVSADSQDRRP